MADWKRAVARVYKGSRDEDGEYCGTAFMISDRWLLTCWHVLRNVQEKDLRLYDVAAWRGGLRRVRRIIANEQVDVALLELSESTDKPNLIPYEEQISATDKQVDCAGFSSRDGDLDCFSVKIGSYRGENNLYVFPVQVGKGVSGAPVLYHGKLVGIARLQDNNKTYLIPLSDFWDLLKNYVYPFGSPIQHQEDINSPNVTSGKKRISEAIPEIKKFVGREEEKELFKDFLKKDKRLLIFLGERGIGKTALLEALYDSAKENKHICAYFKCVGSADEETSILKKFRKQLGEDTKGNIIPYSENIFTSFDDIVKNIESEDSQGNSDKLYKKLWKAFRYAISGLSERIDDSRRIILFFDETERLSPSIREWLRQRVEEYLRTTSHILFVFATLKDIDKRIRWKRSRDIIKKTISEFTKDERKKFLYENLQEKERDNVLIDSVSSVTGNPLALSLFCTVQKSEIIMDIITRINNGKNYSDNFLLNIINEILQEVLSGCDCKKIVQRSSVLRYFNEDILNIVLEKECLQEQCNNFKKCSGEGYLNKVKKSLLIERVRILVFKNIYQYHDQIRNLLYEELQDNIHINCKDLHQAFLEYYKKWYDRLSSDTEKSDLVLLEIIYHQLIIDEMEGLCLAYAEFELARQSFKLSRCTRIISELENFSSKPNIEQVVDFLNGKLAMAKGHYGNAIEKFKQVLEKPDLLIGKDEFEFEVRVACGESFFLQGNHPDSLKELRKALDRVDGREEEFPKIGADAHWIIGRIYRSQGNMRSAAEHLRRCIKLSIQTRRDSFSGYGLCTLGEVYQMQGEYEMAEEALKDSLDRLKEEGNQEILGRSLHILGRVYQFQGKWEKAEAHLKRSLELREKITGGKPQHSLGYAYWGFGWFYLFQRNASAALDNLEKSENIFKTLEGKDGIARTYRLQAEVCLMQDDNEQAAELLHKAIAIQRKKKGNYELGLLHLGLTKYHIAVENWAKAIESNAEAKKLSKESGGRWAQVKSDILQCQIDIHLAQYDDLKSRISKVGVEAENFPDLTFELELVCGEHAVKTDHLDDGVGAYKKAYSKAKAFYHPDEHNADYVAKAIYDQVQSLPEQKKEYLRNALSEIISVVTVQ